MFAYTSGPLIRELTVGLCIVAWLARNVGFLCLPKMPCGGNIDVMTRCSVPQNVRPARTSAADAVLAYKASLSLLQKVSYRPTFHQS